MKNSGFDWHSMHRMFKRYLCEDPDTVSIDGGKKVLAVWGDDRARPFGYRNNKMYIGEHGQTHANMRDEKGVKLGGRNKLKFAGRIWPAKKLISFWEYPPRNKLKSVINDINKALQSAPEELDIRPYEKISNDWEIDIPQGLPDNWSTTTTGSISDTDGTSGKLYKLSYIYGGGSVEGMGKIWQDMGINMDRGEKHVATPVQKKLKSLNPQQKKSLWNYFKTLKDPDPADKALYTFMQRSM